MKPTLDEYRRRRDFTQTPEPRGRERSRPPRGEPSFVIQKHDAKVPHFDFRLQVDGVLCSWVVPDGLPRETHQDRLALQMENFPLEYLDFEGTIPADQYGGGRIEVWDRGTFLNVTTFDGEPVPVAKALEQGRLEFELRGEQARGRYRLDRTEGGAEPRWLLLKS